MKNFLLLILIAPVFGVSQYITIPDEMFEKALVEYGFDDAIDGKVLIENINTVDSLHIYYRGITDLTGIEGFTALISLRCGGNKLKSLDVSKNTALTQLFCISNSLTSLDLSKNTALTDLKCDDNKFDCKAIKAKYNLK
mgnify:CR=1 FL=1